MVEGSDATMRIARPVPTVKPAGNVHGTAPEVVAATVPILVGVSKEPTASDNSTVKTLPGPNGSFTVYSTSNVGLPHTTSGGMGSIVICAVARLALNKGANDSTKPWSCCVVMIRAKKISSKLVPTVAE